jgi:hypothetical protein
MLVHLELRTSLTPNDLLLDMEAVLFLEDAIELLHLLSMSACSLIAATRSRSADQPHLFVDVQVVCIMRIV